MSTSTATGDWWENIAVYESDYVPSTYSAPASVDANHALLGDLRENEFDFEDTGYTYGLLTLALVFIVAGILACCILPCTFACLGKSRQERLAERLNMGPKRHAKGNLLMVLASVAAIATAGGAIWGLEKADSGLSSIEDRTQDVATDLRSVLALSNDTSVALGRVSAAYVSLQENVSNCAGSAIISPLLDEAIDLESFSEGLQSELDALSADSLSGLADDVQSVSDAVGTTEGVRKGVVWPALVASIVVIMVFIVIAFGTYELMACAKIDCGCLSCIISPCTVFLAIVIWISAACAVTLSAISGDFCINPDDNVQTLIADNSNDEGLTELLVYYTTGACATDNEAVDAVIGAQTVAVAVFQDTLPDLYSLLDVCSELEPAVQEVDNSLQELWFVLEDAGELTSCENLNGQYQAAVYDDLCEDVPDGLLGFWVSCAILTVLLLVLAVQWHRMLKQKVTEGDAEEVEANARSRGVWLSRRWSKSVKFGSNASKSSAPPHRHSGRSSSTNAPSDTVQRPVEYSNPHRP